jgi:hypothetical protein
MTRTGPTGLWTGIACFFGMLLDVFAEAQQLARAVHARYPLIE